MGTIGPKCLTTLLFKLSARCYTRIGIFVDRVVGVVEDDDCVVVMVLAATLIAVVEVDDVILTEPLFRLLRDEDALFVWGQNFSFVCTVCNSGFASLF